MSELEELINHLISGKTWRPKTLASSIERQFINPKIMKIQAENKKLREALEFINNTAPPIYEYNEVELRIIMKTRKTLEGLK